MLDPTANAQQDLLVWVIAFIVIFVFAVAFLLRDKHSVGLRVLFLADLALNHLFGAIIYCFSWYEPTSAYLLHFGYDTSHILAAFRLVVFGSAAFVLGGLCVPQSAGQKARARHTVLPSMSPEQAMGVGPNPRKVFWSALVFFGALVPFLYSVPSLNQLSGVAWKLIIGSVFVIALAAFQSGDKRQFYIWSISGVVLFPVYTLLGSGFLSYGIAAALPLGLLILRQMKSKFMMMALLVVGMYLGLSLFVNYFQHRTAYRDVAWIEGGDLSDKTDILKKMFAEFTPLNLSNSRHLESIDARLNQNSLVGIGVERLGQGTIGFLNGETLWLSVAALVPRALWPDKPEYGGSGNWISVLTGLKINENTSFGLGTVLEFYANFGLPGVFLGFFALGLMVCKCDRMASAHLALPAPPWDFYLWFGAGFGLVNNIGFLAETIGAFWACIVSISLLKLIQGRKVVRR